MNQIDNTDDLDYFDEDCNEKYYVQDFRGREAKLSYGRF